MTRFFLFMVLALILAPTAESHAAGAPLGTELPRRDYTAGTGSSPGAFADVWRDPETGDIVTSVIAPRPRGEQSDRQGQWPPIFVYPQVAPEWPPTLGQRPLRPVPWPSPFPQDNRR